MSDIGDFVSYEAAVPVDIRFPPQAPNAGEPTGIRWWVKHAECDAMEALSAKHVKEIQMEQIAAQAGVIDQSGRALEREREKVAVCVTAWEWGDWTFKDGKVPPCTFEGVMEVLNSQKWFYSDPYKAINNLANFTNGNGKPSKKPSASKSGTKPKTTTGKRAAKGTRA